MIVGTGAVVGRQLDAQRRESSVEERSDRAGCAVQGVGRFEFRPTHRDPQDNGGALAGRERLEGGAEQEGVGDTAGRVG